MSRQFSTFARFLLLVLAVTAVLTLTVHASPTNQETPRPRFGLEDIAYQAGAENAIPNESTLSVTAPDIILPWSKVTFQSLRNGSWDIFVGNDDGTGQTAVVASGNAEIHPHLNRGNTKIVYASNSGGDYEIYTANFNGSGQTALTSNTTSDGNPSWSPDGSKIVFEAYRNGEADIYVMNANGTNQVRLTTHSDFDGMPTWSPDGSKIAFVSRRTGGYRIYVMNADGSGQTQLSNQPYSLRPQWSPDGTQIAYDADGDGDGWQDLWRMNADGTSQTLVVNPGGQTDAWTSSWSPDGSRIVYTLISFVYYQGNWYWTTAYPETWGSGLATTRLSSNGADWDATWQTGDISPPISQMTAIPNFTRLGELLVSWEGIDNHSGIKTYEVQYKNLANDIWVDWLSTNDTHAFFAEPKVGETYQFRARAIDNAFNVNPWAYINKYQTTFFTRYIQGEIFNNRGVPVLDYDIVINPTTVALAHNQSNHNYQAWLSSFGDHTIDIESPNYGLLPQTTRLISENLNLMSVLPPFNNLLIDSNFEAGDFSVSAWEFSGDVSPMFIQNGGHTGDWGMALGEAPSGSTEISANSCVRPLGDTGLPACNFTSIQAAINAAGFQDTVWVFPGVYQENIIINIGVNLRSVAGPFLTSINGNYEGTVIRIESSNTLIEGFTIENGVHSYDGGGIYTRSTADSVTIRNNRLINNTGSMGGGIKFLYASPLIVNNWFINNTSIGTSPPQGTCIDGSLGTSRIYNNIFWQNGGSGHCVSLDSYIDGAVYNNTFVSNFRGIEIGEQVDTQNNIFVNSTLDGASRFIGGCLGDEFQYNNVWNNNPNYDCPPLTGEYGNRSINPGFVNIIAADFRLQVNSPLINLGNPDGEFNDPDGSRNDMGAFGGPFAFPQSPIEIGDTWSHAWYDLSDWAGQTITVSLSIKNNVSNQTRSKIYQTVAIPVSMENPTLAFLYRMGQKTAVGSEQFVVSIQPDAGLPAEFVVESSAISQIWLYVDEVTLGSSHTDIWVDLKSQTEALPGKEVTYTVTYGNNSSLNANGTVITAVLPPQLTFLSASLPPSSSSPGLTWNIGDLPANSGPLSFTITARVKNTAQGLSNATSTINITTSSTELEVFNNVGQSDLLIGTRLYIPLIIKN